MDNNQNWIKLPSPNPISPLRGNQLRLNSNQDSYNLNQGGFFKKKSPLPIRTTPRLLFSPCQSYNERNNYNELFDEISLIGLYENPLVEIQQPCISTILDFNIEDSQIDLPKTPNFRQVSPIKKVTGVKQLPTTIKKQQSNHEWDTKKISRPKDKGLRKLSAHALQIVVEMKSATYKEVATKLVSQIFQQNTLEIDCKDQQNIKRRVYDALNVMIALGILKKEGRKIVQESHFRKKNHQYHSNAINQLELINEHFQKCQQNIQSKKKRLFELKKKHKIISNLINRNKNLQTQQPKILFPFIGTNLKDMNEDTIKELENGYIIKSNKKLKLFGDVDSLNFISSINLSS